MVALSGSEAASQVSEDPDRYGVRSGRLEASMELSFRPLVIGSPAPAREPLALIGVQAGVFAGNHLRLGATVRALLAGRNADFLEVTFDAGIVWLTGRLRTTGSIELGYSGTEFIVDDTILTNDGFTLNLMGGASYVVFDDLALGVELGWSLTSLSEGDSDWSHGPRLALVVSTLW